MTSRREYLLDQAKAVVTGPRANQYGPPDQDFDNIASMWTVLLRNILAPGAYVTAGDIAKCMIALKLSRLMHSPAHEDSWLDIAGYAACGHEVTVTDPVEAIPYPEGFYDKVIRENPNYQAGTTNTVRPIDEDIKYRRGFAFGKEAR